METPTNAPVTNLINRFNTWIQESIMVKLFSIGFLVLILLIPSTWIDSLIYERQQRAEDVIDEISEKWSDSQTLSGPILVIPYTYHEKITKANNETEIFEKTENAFFLPETLNVSGTIDPQTLHRGIFEAVVYGTDLDIKAAFNYPDFKALSIPEDRVQWKNAQLIFGITDIGGIRTNPQFTVGDQSPTSEPSNNLGVSIKKFRKGIHASYATDGSNDGDYSNEGIVTKLHWNDATDFNGKTSITLSLRGSERLNFVPTGKSTSVDLKGEWPEPSFDGKFLPDTREVTDTSFAAKWNVLHFNRPFAQQWVGNGSRLVDSEFGLRLLIPVEQYQKSIRTSKYSQLIIIFTFVALFLVEITRKIRIHPFQYILIGVALIIYYTLLLSISEQVGYNIAYWIATVATVGLVSAYAKTFLHNWSLVTLLTLLMTIFYSFIFVIILQQDLSLLIGSIGLFLVVAALMYFSRKVSWYREPAA